MPHKDYTKFVKDKTFAVNASRNCPLIYVDIKNKKDNFFAVSACEDVHVYNLQRKTKVMTLTGENYSVSAMAYSKHDDLLAVGYADGTLKLFGLKDGEEKANVNAHKSAISYLSFGPDHSNSHLISGGKDCTLSVWDSYGLEGITSLLGHKAPITCCKFLKDDIILSSSEDKTLKFWFLNQKHCFKTIPMENSIKNFAIMRNGKNIFVAAEKVLAYEVVTLGEDEIDSDVEENEDDDDEEDETNEEQPMEDDQQFFEDNFYVAPKEAIVNIKSPFKILFLGEIDTSNARIVSMSTDEEGMFLSLYGSSNLVESLRFLTPSESTKKHSKRIKKQTKEGGTPNEDYLLQDIITKLANFEVTSCSGRKGVVKGLSLKKNGDNMMILTLLSDNSVNLYTRIYKDGKQIEAEEDKQEDNKILYKSHRTEPVALAYARCISRVLSLSKDSIQIWNESTLKLLHSLDFKNGTCCLFLSDATHFIVGNKKGELTVINTTSVEATQSIKAHDGVIHSICLLPSDQGIVSVSADKVVKFWKYEKVKGENLNMVQLSEEKKSLTCLDEVLFVKCSSNIVDENKHLMAVSLSNCKVRVHYMDSLKLFLELVSHNQPVVCMDIADDNKLIATGSSDKNIKIWELQFGQCLRSIFAHDNTITCLRFVSGTHMLFSGSLDQTIRHWDMDTYHRVVTLRGHQQGINDLVVLASGDIVSCGGDFSLRTWKDSEEVLVPDEDRLEEKDGDYYAKEYLLQEEADPYADKESKQAGVKSMATIDFTDMLIEAVRLYKEEVLKYNQKKQECEKLKKPFEPPQVDKLIIGYGFTNPMDYLRYILKRIHVNERKRVLMSLSFDLSFTLLRALTEMCEHSNENTLPLSYIETLLILWHQNLLRVKGFKQILEKINRNKEKKFYPGLNHTGVGQAGLHIQREYIDGHSIY